MSHASKSGAAGSHLNVMRTELGRVRGLGSAKSGVREWWMQRLTALALVPLSLWFIGAVLLLKDRPRMAAAHWIASPINTVLLIALLTASFQHMQLGLQVVIEDYVHRERARLALLVLMKGASFLLGLAGIVSVLRLAF